MLSSLLKFLLFCILLLLTIVNFLLFTTKFVFLNKSFYAYSLNRDNTYKNLTKGIKSAASEFLISQISASGNFAKLTLGEREEIEKQVEDLTSFINESTVSDFLEVNIDDTLSYLNNKSDGWNIYLPLEKWGLPDEFLKQIPDNYKKTDISIKEILASQKQDTPNNLQLLSSLKLFRGKYKNI